MERWREEGRVGSGDDLTSPMAEGTISNLQRERKGEKGGGGGRVNSVWKQFVLRKD